MATSDTKTPIAARSILNPSSVPWSSIQKSNTIVTAIINSVIILLTKNHKGNKYKNHQIYKKSDKKHRRNKNAKANIIYD